MCISHTLACTWPDIHCSSFPPRAFCFFSTPPTTPTLPHSSSAHLLFPNAPSSFFVLLAASSVFFFPAELLSSSLVRLASSSVFFLPASLTLSFPLFSSFSPVRGGVDEYRLLLVGGGEGDREWLGDRFLRGGVELSRLFLGGVESSLRFRADRGGVESSCFLRGGVRVGDLERPLGSLGVGVRDGLRPLRLGGGEG